MEHIDIVEEYTSGIITYNEMQRKLKTLYGNEWYDKYLDALEL